MHIAFGRVRRKTSPARGGTCVFIFRIHHSFKEIGFRVSFRGSGAVRNARRI